MNLRPPGVPAIFLYRKVARDDIQNQEYNYARIKILTEEGRQYAAFISGYSSVPVAFASLPACSGGLEGVSRAVNNSNTATYNATVAGGGANHIVAYCNGTNWVAH